MIAPQVITGLVLSGGRGTRMGGLDKGLELFEDLPLAVHAARRLSPQAGAVLINANRHLEQYAGFGWPVQPDTVPDSPGPLAGLLAGLRHSGTPWVACVPCDSPLFPLDLVARLAGALQSRDEKAAVASAPAQDGVPRRQPAFLLVHASLEASLSRFLSQGGRKVGLWLAEVSAIEAPFGPPRDAVNAFANANTLAELRALERPAAARG